MTRCLVFGPSRLGSVAAAACLGVGMCLAVGAAARTEAASSSAERIVAPLDLRALHGEGVLKVEVAPEMKGSVRLVLDGQSDTGYEAPGPGPVALELTLPQAKRLRGARLLLGQGRHRWRVEAPAAGGDCGGQPDVLLLGPQECGGNGRWAEATLDEPAAVRTLRLVVEPRDPSSRVRIRELVLVAEQQLNTLSVESPVQVAQVGGDLDLVPLGRYSGGLTRRLDPRSVRWTVSPARVARITREGRLHLERQGPITVRASVGEVRSLPLHLEVVQP